MLYAADEARDVASAASSTRRARYAGAAAICDAEPRATRCLPTAKARPRCRERRAMPRLCADARRFCRPMLA